METRRVHNRKRTPAGPKVLFGLGMLFLTIPVPAEETAPAISGALRPVTEASARLADPPLLRDMLPRNAVAYVRIPSLWGLLGVPKGNIMDQALRSTAYTEALSGIRNGLAQNLLPEVPPEVQPLVGLLLSHIRSPVELVVLPPVQTNARLPTLVATAALDSPDVASANRVVKNLAQQEPEIDVQAPLGADGSGMLSARGVPVQMYFQAANRRLYLASTDAGTQPTPLAAWVAGLQPIDAHPMHDAEPALDSSGQGLFAWIDPEGLIVIMERLGRAQEVALIRAFGGSEAKSMALGMGTSQGKQRLKVLLDMPRVGFRSFLPAVDTDLSFRTAGTPDVVGMLGLPGPDDLAMIESSLLGLMPPEEVEGYRAAKKQFAEALGFSIEDLLGAFGQELLLVMDQAGSYVAVRLRDADAYRRILDRLVQGLQLEYEQREVQGQTYHHLQIPPLDPKARDQLAHDAIHPLEQRLSEIPSHLYWTREGDYLLFAMPHVLLDYRYLADKRPLGEWLRRSQGMEPNGALLLASIRSKGTPNLMYAFNLLLLTYLGDLAGQPVDLFALPTPRELDLPEYGSYSLQLSSSPHRLALEVVYESNPIELLMAGGGLQGTLMTGIIAGVAMAAYNDYQLQAHMAVLVPHLKRIQQEVTQFQVTNGRFPAAAEAASVMENSPNWREVNVSVELEPDTGVIYVQFGLDSPVGQSTLLLSPNGAGGWTCDGSLSAEHYFPTGLCGQ